MTPIATETIEKAIAILGTDEISEDEIEAKIAALVTDAMIARRLIDWIPEAFGIALVSHMAKIVLPTTFSAMAANGEWQEFKFNLEPVFTTSIRIALQMYHDGPGNVFRNIAVRSSSLNAANKLLHRGESLDGAALSGPALIGIPAEVYSPTSKSFWRRLFS